MVGGYFPLTHEHVEDELQHLILSFVPKEKSSFV